MSVTEMAKLRAQALKNDKTIDATEAQGLVDAAKSPEDRRYLREVLAEDRFDRGARTATQRALYGDGAPRGFEGAALGTAGADGVELPIYATRYLGPPEGFKDRADALAAAKAGSGVTVVIEDRHGRFHALATDLAGGPGADTKAHFSPFDNSSHKSMELVNFLPGSSTSGAVQSGVAQPTEPGRYALPGDAVAFKPAKAQVGGHSFKKVRDGKETKVIAFTAKMYVDTDGAPHVARSKAEADKQNAGAARRGEAEDWVWNANHLKNTAIAWETPDGKKVKTEQLNARDVPYIVVSPEMLTAGVKKGDLVLVKHGDKQVYAVVGDVSRSGHIGEASMATNRALGFGDDPHTGGRSRQDVQYIILPNTRGMVMGAPKTFDEIQRIGAQAFEDAQRQGWVQ